MALPESPKDQDTIIVSRGTAKITFGDIDAYVQRIPEKDRAGFMDSPKRIENVLQGLLLQRQLAQTALDLKPDQKLPMDRVEKLAMEKELSKQTLDAYKQTIKSPDMLPLARETYLVHKQDYLETGRIDVQQILITTDKRADEEAKKLALEVEKQAKAQPDSFTDLIKKYSEESNKDENQGMITGASNEKYSSELAETVNKLKHDGEISTIVKTSFGYHVLKLVKRMPDRQKTFDEVRETLIAQMAAKYIDQQMHAFINTFEDMPLEANPELVASLRDRYMSPPAPPVGNSAITPSSAAR